MAATEAPAVFLYPMVPFNYDFSSSDFSSDCQFPSPFKASICNWPAVSHTFVSRRLQPSFVQQFSCVALLTETRYFISRQIFNWTMDNQHSLFIFWFSFSQRSLPLSGLKSTEIAKSLSPCKSLSIRASAGQQAFHFLPPTEHNFFSEIKFSVGLKFFFFPQKNLWYVFRDISSPDYIYHYH